MKSRELTLAAALMTITGGMTGCSSSEQTTTASAPADANTSGETLAPQTQDSNIDDFVRRYQEGQGDPVESQVFEKPGANGQVERYALIDVPATKPDVHAADQDSVKPAQNIKVLQQLDGAKTDTLTETNKSHYHGTHVYVRYYPSYGNGAYNGGVNAFSNNYHGYYTDISERVHNVGQRQVMHQSLAKGFVKNGRGIFSKVNFKGLNAATKLAGLHEVGSFGKVGRIGGVRGSFRGASFHAGG